jgi:predicted outer membrane repeat protein
MTGKFENHQGVIENCKFTNSEALTKGGGLTIIDVRNFLIKSTEFINNTANNQGGGLLFSCNSTMQLDYLCDLVI